MNYRRSIFCSKQKTHSFDDYSLYTKFLIIPRNDIRILREAKRKGKRNERSPPRVPPISLTRVPAKEIVAPDLPSVLSSTRTLRLLLLLLLPSSLLIHQLAISRRRHGIRQCSHGRNAIQMPFPCRFYVPVLRASRRGGKVRRSGAEVVANCGTDPRTRPAGNGEELSRMDESSPRVGFRAGWAG